MNLDKLFVVLHWAYKGQTHKIFVLATEVEAVTPSEITLAQSSVRLRSGIEYPVSESVMQVMAQLESVKLHTPIDQHSRDSDDGPR